MRDSPSCIAPPPFLVSVQASAQARFSAVVALVRPLTWAASLASLATLAACGGSPRAIAAGDAEGRASPASGSAAASATSGTFAIDAARWELHPPGGAHARARLDLDAGRSVYVTDGGARWLVRWKGAEGTSESAPTLLPEALVTVARATSDASPSSTLWFVGESGTVYPARDPLGPTEEPRRPPFPLRSVTAGRVALVGLTEGGRLMRTLYGGASWVEVKIGGASAKLAEVALSRAGFGLALGDGGELLGSNDDGATWRPLGMSGVLHVFVAADGELYAERANADFGVLRSGRMAKGEAPKRVFVLPQAGDGRPRVSALRRGAAAWGDSRLVSIELGPQGASIVEDAIGEAPRREAAPDLSACQQAWPAIAGDALAVACDARPATQQGDAWLPLRILKRDARGGPFHEEAVLGSGNGEKHLWLSPRGAIFVTGACLARDARGASRAQGCDAPDALAKPAGATAFAPSRTSPPRKNVAYVFWYAAFSATGDRLYALADDVNNVHGRTMLLISKDDGLTFAERYLPAIPAPGGRTLRPEHTGGLFPAPDGTLRVTALASDGASKTWLVYETKDDAASFDVRVSHLDKPRGIDFYDRRGFAWDPHGAGWETTDAGKTWIPLPAPADGVPLAEEHAPVIADLDMEFGAVSRKLACGERGCFVGDVATRVGWSDARR